MAIRKPVKLAWNGKSKKLIVTMLVIERIQNEVGIMELTKVNADNMNFPLVSKFFYILLDEAGFDLTWDQVFDNIFDTSNSDSRALLGVMAEIMPMFLPNFKTVIKKKTRAKTKKK